MLTVRLFVILAGIVVGLLFGVWLRIRQLAAMRATVDAPAEQTRGVYCYGARERARRRRQIVDGIIKVGYVPSLRVRRATGENWSK